MRLGSFTIEGRASYGLIAEQGVIDLGRRLAPEIPDLKMLLATGLDQAKSFANLEVDLSFDRIEWLPPIPDPGQILCVGLNYRAHAAEVGRPVGEKPTIFLRVAQSQCAHLAPIVRPTASSELDFEGELALVVGTRGRAIDNARAMQHIAGYSLYNDASLRDWQRHSGQYTPGKNFPGTGAFGPWLVTADEIPDPTRLTLTTRLNGEVVQRAPLTDLIFPLPDIIAYLSSFTELRPGDVIITGTPAGVGSMRDPPLWMRPGDTVSVEIPEIGMLTNPVVQET